LGKTLVGLHFGRISQKLIWSPGLSTEDFFKSFPSEFDIFEAESLARI
jgi:hypothetical protein